MHFCVRSARRSGIHFDEACKLYGGVLHFQDVIICHVVPVYVIACASVRNTGRFLLRISRYSHTLSRIMGGYVPYREFLPNRTMNVGGNGETFINAYKCNCH